jgi:hypothetical protein
MLRMRIILKSRIRIRVKTKIPVQIKNKPAYGTKKKFRSCGGSNGTMEGRGRQNGGVEAQNGDMEGLFYASSRRCTSLDEELDQGIWLSASKRKVGSGSA